LPFGDVGGFRCCDVTSASGMPFDGCRDLPCSRPRGCAVTVLVELSPSVVFAALGVTSRLR
jgi:hypothetical protein